MNALVLALAALTFAVMRLSTPEDWRFIRNAYTLAVGALVAVALWTVRQPITVSVVLR